MNSKGQIVEILESSPLFQKRNSLDFYTKEDFLSVSQKRNYSLFDGFLVGEHQGVGNFRLGQRKGLNLGGKKQPVFVIAIDKEENRLFVGEGSSHPGLFSKVFEMDECKLENYKELIKLENKTEVKVRSELDNVIREAEIYVFDHSIFLVFDECVSVSLDNYNISVFI